MNPPGPNPPNVPGVPARVPSLRFSECGHAERCPKCDDTPTTPFVLILHAGEGLRRDVVVLSPDLLSAAGSPQAVACVYSIGAGPPVVGMPVALAYSLEEWPALRRAIDLGFATHAAVWPPSLRAKEAEAASRDHDP